MQIKSWIAALLVAGITVGVVMRWACPRADPPVHRQVGAYWSDETLGHDARARVVWGSPPPDAWQPRAYVPLYSLIAEASMRTLGSGYFGLRFPVMLFGTILLGSVYVTSRVAGFSPTASMVSSFFIATSWSLTGISKIAIVESQMLLFASAMFLCVIAGETRTKRRASFFAAGGMLAACALLTKLSALGFVGPLGLFLLVLPRGEGWRERLRRAVPFSIAVAVVGGFGYAVTVFVYSSFFQQIVFDVYLVGRHKSSIGGFLYNAITMFDSQALLTMPFIAVCVLLSIPALVAPRESDVPGVGAPRQFAVKLCLFTLALGMALHVFVDVPARRMVWVNLPIALLAAALWDASGEDMKMEEFSNGWILKPIRAGLAVVSGLLLVGWVVSPNGGLPAILTPVWASWLYFTIPAKITYKIVWATTGLVVGLLILWKWRGQVSRRMLTGVLVAHFALYLAASGLWLARMSYTLYDTSVALGGRVPAGSYVLGNNAVALQYENRTRPLMWYPDIPYGNRDESVIRERFAPHYLLLPDRTLAQIRSGALPLSSYMAEFLQHEVDRFPIYEFHESTHLGGEFILFEK